MDEARAFFAHPSQQILGITPDTLPGEPFEYWASGPLCVVFHLGPWPGVWMAHYAAKPEGWGFLVPHARRILDAFWREKEPARIVGWTEAKNRAAVAFARRIGFTEDGRMALPDGVVIMSGWSPKWA